MSVSTVSSTTSSSTLSSSSNSSTSDMSTEDFLSILVSQLQNQNPLDPTDSDTLLDQMVSFASYSQQSDMSDALESINDTLSAIATQLDVSA